MTDWWQHFFHAPIEPASLALFRVLVGVLIVANATTYAKSAAAILDPAGMLPFETWRMGPDRRFASILRWLPASRGSVRVLLVVYAVAGACLSLGWGTRWAAGVAFVAGMSLNHRNRWVLHSGDVLLRVLTFLLIFSDAGRVWSIDAVLAEAPPTPPAPGAPWAQRLMQIQVSLLYLTTFWHKLRGRTWRRGTASHYATHFLAHRRRRLPAWLDTRTAHRAATWGTLAAELAGGTLIWFAPARPFALAGLVALHLTLQFLMRMHLFQWTMLASLVLFVPGEMLARLWDLVGAVWVAGVAA